MLKRVKTQTGPAPLIGGRSAFRGVINPLILAGGRFGQSPDIWAAEYANAEPNPVAVQQQKITIVNPAPELCPTSQNLKDWCDKTGNNGGFCRKRQLPATSAECSSIQEPECEYTDALKKVCSNSQSPFLEFCKGYKINGQCYDEYIKQRDADERAKKDAAGKKAKEEADAKAKEDAQAEQVKINNWKVNRGCRFHREDLTEADALTQTPCRTPAFNDAKVGQYISGNGYRWKFLGWTPAQP